jgi:hypothetical protein
MSSLWDAVFIQVIDRIGPLMLNLSGTPYNYGFCLANGEGVSKNQEEAVSYFRLPADQKHVDAQFQYGSLETIRHRGWRIHNRPEVHFLQ